MRDYDFLVLSSLEFENFSRDILQKKLNVFIESFTSGRDGGIDLRCAKNEQKNIIIQAKRYKNFSELLSKLKKEVEKVKRLKPDRYIITTSVGLTPQNKEIIKTLFVPFIVWTEDILWRDDLNGLLWTYPDVESMYYKLWLSSTHILQTVLHSKVYNRSAFELEEIRKEVQSYVQNESFNRALEILRKHKYVIISGLPGIWKTTLSRVLVLYLLSKWFEEFIFLSDSIDDGYELFSEHKKQIFFFDDFLGKNFFQAKNLPNEDNKIVKFIEKMKRSKNKILILATREYILNQATYAFEAFKINNIEIAKCILDLSSYTNIIKAHIIYNHLFFWGVPHLYLMDLIKDKQYLKLVLHQNYNPRIIEVVIKQKIWEKCPPDEFSNKFIAYFDNPDSVWLHAYENSLDKFAQYTLLVLLSIGTPVLLEDLEDAVKVFFQINFKSLNINFDNSKFHKTLKALENTFIKTQKDDDNKISVDYQNPSVQDFLVNYVKGRGDLINYLLSSAIFTSQFFNIFTTSVEKNPNNKKRVLLNSWSVKLGTERIKEVLPSVRNSRISKIKISKNRLIYYKDSNYLYSFLRNIYDELGISNPEAKELVYTQLQNSIYIMNLSYSELQDYIYLLQTLDLSKLNFDENTLVDSCAKLIESVYTLELFWELKAIFEKAFLSTIETDEFEIRIRSILKDQIDTMEESDVFSTTKQFRLLGDIFDLPIDSELEEIREKERWFEEQLLLQENNYFDNDKYDNTSEEYNELKIINEIFNNLTDNW